MFDYRSLEEVKVRKQKWDMAASQCGERRAAFVTSSGVPVERLYTPLDMAGLDYSRDLSFPGEYPFTRGVHSTGHRGRLWTMRMFSGFGGPEESNKRYKYLLSHGETGLSVAFDFPTLNGYDTDSPRALGEFGKCGVAVCSLADMEALFDDIPVDKITTSMTINGPAAVIWAMYLVAAEKRGISMARLGGTIQNDILKEYIAQNSYIFPPKASMRLIVDTIEYGMKNVPLWNTVSISGYHIREAGATALQELAFTLADGLAYVQAGVERGLEVDDFAPRLSFFFDGHNDFFEEVGKFRAARRIWAREVKERFRARNERSMWLRFHTQTAGCTLTAQQPENNVVRTTIQALAAVMGGTQSLHTNSMDEALALPSELAVRVALRTQQIIANESGVTNTIDPLAGSYFVEALTNNMEKGAYEYFRKIEALGGVLGALDKGFFHREIADSAFRYQRDIEAGDRVIVGVNEYGTDEPVRIPLLKLDPEGMERQLARLTRLRRERDNAALAGKLKELEEAARGSENLMPFIVGTVRACGTLGEICDCLRGVFGEYKAPVTV
ncbi:MAG: methylmalonyl-CoA mutase family protein [Chloroflexi bacterium]|nr:methylmalonyl-CoA mutase family protein [Chloroflexota bacterium]